MFFKVSRLTRRRFAVAVVPGRDLLFLQAAVIGLTVVRDMAMAMGGTVAVDSKKDQGAVFTVELPCKHGSDIKQNLEMRVEPLRNLLRRPPRIEPNDLPCTPATDATRPVVLVVEDHSDVAHVVGRALGDDYTVHYASNGEQALVKMNDLCPDLIITDVKMPLMDGLELCRRLHQSKRFSHIPVIMLSARTRDKDRINGIEAGADAYLVKPFVREELCVWANRLLESRKVMREAIAASREHDDENRSLGLENSQEEDDNRFLAAFAHELDKQCSSGAKLDFDRIAHTFKMGETQLRRKIQALTGMNVPAYVTRLRMEKAMRLLRENPDLLIGDIAEQCGFQDVAYFSRVFRQHYGMAPSQARNNGK